MENEKKNIRNENAGQPEDKVQNKSRSWNTAAIVAVTLVAGLLAGGGIYKFRNGVNTARNNEISNQVTTVSETPETETASDKVTEKEVEKVTVLEKEKVTTVPETEGQVVSIDMNNPVTSPETALSGSSEKTVKNSPLRNKNHIVYSDILNVIPQLERFNAEFSSSLFSRASSSLYQPDAEPEYIDIVVGADVTYSYCALMPIEQKAEAAGGTQHSNRYYKVSTLGTDYQNKEYEYKTEEDVRTALEEYFTDSFIENHYISDYDDVPGRYTVFKIINGELYVTVPDDIGMMVPAQGNVYNYDGKRCDVKTADYSPDIHSDPLHVSLVLEDGKWKIDGYEHTGNIIDATSSDRNLYSEYKDTGEKAVEDLMALEGVVLCCGVSSDENDTVTEDYFGAKVLYQRVTDERFSNVEEVENFICTHAIEDLRLRCIDHIRGTNGTYPVYKMIDGALYCYKFDYNKYYCLREDSKSFSVLSADDNSIQIGIDPYMQIHNFLFLKNTEDGWKICDLD